MAMCELEGKEESADGEPTGDVLGGAGPDGLVGVDDLPVPDRLVNLLLLGAEEEKKGKNRGKGSNQQGTTNGAGQGRQKGKLSRKMVCFVILH